MKDVRFYLEFPTKSAKKHSGKKHIGHTGNVLALFVNDPYQLEGIGALFEHANSPVASTGVSREWLEQCKRIPERLARKIHPTLFIRIDGTDTIKVDADVA